MKKISFLAILGLSLLACKPAHQPGEKDRGVVEYAKANNLYIKLNNVENADPAVLYCYSSHLWNEGQKDEAVFWYYVAQYRYRFLGITSEKLKAGSFSEAEGRSFLMKVSNKDNLDNLHLIGGIYRIDLYGAIQQILGPTINGYAYGDLEQLQSTLDELLAYEVEHPFNPMGLDPQPVLKSKEIQAENLEKVKESYLEQKQEITEKAEDIKAERVKNGLENR